MEGKLTHGFGQGNMEGHPSRDTVERIQSLAGSDPKYSRSVLAAGFDIVARQTQRVSRVMSESRCPSGRRVQREEALAGCKPQQARPILADVNDMRILRIEGIVDEGLCCAVVPVERLIGTDPNRAFAILEERVDENPAQAIGSLGMMREHLEPIAVVPAQPVLRPEP